MTETSPEKILKEIEVMINSDVSVIDALVQYADKYGLEVELVGEIVKRSTVLKALAREDAEKNNLLERTARLPI